MKHLYTFHFLTALVRCMRAEFALLFALLTLLTASAHAQHRSCSAHEIHARKMASDTQYAASHRALEDYTVRYLDEYLLRNEAANKTGLITVPVVFHIISNGEPVGTGANIADAQILSQLQVLNEDMRRTNPDAVNTPARFQGVAADCQVEFCIALQDPQGVPALGINRINGGQPDWDVQQIENLKPTLAWDPNRYLNIYVLDLFTRTGALGFATFPVSPVPLNDGIVCDFRTVGRFPANPFNNFFNGSFNLGRTATHEIGHWLNCFHIWGDDGNLCIGSDNVGDTPNQAGPTPGCPQGGNVIFSCNNAPNGNMFMNYLDLTDDACMNMYSLGQKVRMDATFDFIRTGFLNSTRCDRLFTTTNITAVAATLTWSPWIGVAGYNVRWRIIGGNGVWTNGFAAVNTLNIAGLTPSPNPAAFQFTAYEWQVQPIFANGTGAFSGSQLFRTLGLAPPVVCPYDPNENAVFGPYLMPGTQNQGIICPATDRDRFVIMNNYMQGGTLRIILSNLVLDYDIELRNVANNNLLASSVNAGLVNDTIRYSNFPMGNYYVYVFAKMPGIVAVQPYTVRMLLFPPGAPLPPGMRTAPETALRVYPNPAKDVISISLSGTEGDFTAMLSDLTGKTLKYFSGNVFTGENRTFPVDDLESGIYFLRVRAGKEQFTEKICIAR